MKRTGLPGLVSSSLSLAALLSVSGCMFDWGERADPDIVDPPLPTSGYVTFQADAELLYAAFRSAEGTTWQRKPNLTGNRFVQLVDGPYTVMVVCSALPSGPNQPVRPPHTILYSGRFYAGRGGQPPPEIQLSCRHAQPTPFVVRGAMAEPGTVTLGKQRASSTQPGWTFEFPVAPGTYDLIAAGRTGAPAAERVVVQRGLVIEGDRTLPPIDLAQQGVALAPVEIGAIRASVPGEIASAVTLLRTVEADTTEIYRGAFPARIPAGDPLGELFVGARSERNTADVSVSRVTTRLLDPSTKAYTFALWQPFSGLQSHRGAQGELELSWRASALLNLSRLEATLRDAQGRSITYVINGDHWVHHPLTSLSFDTQGAGYLPEWRVDLAQPHTLTLELYGSGDATDVMHFSVEQRGGEGPITP